MSDRAKVRAWSEQAPYQPSRWPGAAVRGPKNEIDFRRGVVLAVTDLAITVELGPPFHALVKLMGESYAHYCPHCTATIPGNVTYRRPAGSVMHDGQEIPIRFFWPYCGPDHLLRMVQKGAKMRLHYRFEKDRSSGGWFGEVVNQW